MRAEQPARNPPHQQHETDATHYADAAIDLAPAEAAGDERHQRQTDRSGEGPAEKDVSDAAAPLLRRHQHADHACRLRSIRCRSDAHHQADSEQHRIVGRKGRSEIAHGHDRDDADQHVPSLDPAGQPRHQRRADAQHHCAEGDQKPRLADRDTQPRRQLAEHRRRPQQADAGDEIADHECGGRVRAGDCQDIASYGCNCMQVKPASQACKSGQPDWCCNARIGCYTARPLTCARVQE